MDERASAMARQDTPGFASLMEEVWKYVTANMAVVVLCSAAALSLILSVAFGLRENHFAFYGYVFLTVLFVLLALLGHSTTMEGLKLPVGTEPTAKVEEAKEIAGEVRIVGKNIARLAIHMLYGKGGLTATSDEEVRSMDSLRNEVFSLINTLRLPDEDRKELEDIDFMEVCYQYVSYLYSSLPFTKRHLFSPKIRTNYPSDIGDLATPDEIRNALEEMNFLNERERYVEMYDYYYKNRKHLDPHEWGNRHRWGST